MERLVEAGLVRHIGTSNMTIPKMELLLRDARIKPACNQMELHPHFQQPEFFKYLVERDIVPIGFCPLGSPSCPERDRTPTDTVVMEDPVIVKISNRLNIHPAEVCIKWAVQRGQIPIPFSVFKRHQYLANIKAVVGEPLTEEEMKEIESIDKNCRLIKGQVFLWEGAKGWERSVGYGWKDSRILLIIFIIYTQEVHLISCNIKGCFQMKKKILQKVEEQIRCGPFSASWDSLENYHIPNGMKTQNLEYLFIGEYILCPAFGNEWYPRNMYIKGSKEYEYHIANYGPHNEFGYKDFIPMFKAEKFNPEEWAELFKKSGARYVVPVAEHHDGFQMYDSSLSRWNAAQMGPKRDI